MNPVSTVTETFIVKKDINVLTMQLRRSRKGILVTVKADALLEDLFRDWGGASKPVVANLHGRSWEGVGGIPLPNCYGLEVIPDARLKTQSGRLYEITKLGCPLVDEQGINLGFLRLIGISDPAGVTFAIKGVASTEEIRRISQDLQEAIRHFYINYIKPVDVVIQMHTQEI